MRRLATVALHCRPRRPARRSMPLLPLRPVWRPPRYLCLPDTVDQIEQDPDWRERQRHLARLLADLPGMMRKEPSP